MSGEKSIFRTAGLAVFATLVLAPAPGERTVSLRFTDVTSEAGIRFEHTSGRSGDFYYPEIMGGGACFFDYDGDGDLDLYVVNGKALKGPIPTPPPTSHLFRNNGDGTFTDATAETRTGNTGYGQGCCAADYDGDGDVDLYVTNYGPNFFYRNDGGGRFTNIAAQNGTADGKWGQGCAFADFDGDGILELFVENYLEWSVATHKWCGEFRDGRPLRSYCPPRIFPGTANRLYKQAADGIFRDRARELGITETNGKGMGLICGDVDNDGDIDIFVTNDGTQNFLYRNDGRGRFEEVGLQAGVGFDEEGKPEGSMGADLGDVDRDGYLDIIVPSLANESFALYHNNGNGTFTDVSFSSGIGQVSLRFTGFSPSFLDADNDGDLDLFVSNGKVYDVSEISSAASFIERYGQTALLFENDGRGHFSDVSSDAGSYFLQKKIGRGTAVADYDNDGDLDVFIVNLDDKPALLRNDTPAGNHWITLRLRGKGKNMDAVGARVTVQCGGIRQIAEVRNGGSYLSQSDSRVHFGLGPAKVIDRLEVRWPRGMRTVLEGLPVDRFMKVTEPE